MSSRMGISVTISLVLTLSGITWISIPRTMAIPLMENENGIYTSEIFRVPVRIKDAELDISLWMNSYLRVWCEIRVGENYIKFNFNEMSMDYHFEFDIFEFVGSLSDRDVSLTAKIETDGIIQEVPEVVLTYYGLW